MRRLPLYVAVFLVGFAIMGFEMIASRLIVPWFGGGIDTWAALISTVLAGLGSTPYSLPGNVYLTGPYDGAPFGLSTVTDANHVGPFGIGTIVARSTINVNELTAAALIDTEAVTVYPTGGGQPEQFAGLDRKSVV